MEKKVQLFVYGTLRLGGLAGEYLKAFKLVDNGLRLNGFTMYDAGWYPFAVRATDAFSILGDVFEVPESSLPELDDYEGPQYSRIFLEDRKFFIYLKKDNKADGFVQVEEGDWLSHWRRKSR